MIKFKDQEHQQVFHDFLIAANVKHGDKERLSMFYIFALYADTINIYDLYDFDTGHIILEGLHKAWQTGGTIRATKLAFNLFKGYKGQMEEGNQDYSPLELFCIDTEYLLEAVKIRFGILASE